MVDGGDCAEALEELLGAIELEDSLVSNGYIPGALKWIITTFHRVGRRVIISMFLFDVDLILFDRGFLL